MVEALLQLTSETKVPFVYGLVDPADPKHIRYVGLAGVRDSRPKDHAKAARKETQHSHLLHWVRKLHAEGREYSILILEQLNEGVSRDLLGFVEQCYIKSLRDIGHRLTNATDGGDGVRPTLETRAKIQAAASTPEARESRRRSALGNQNMLGKVQSKETRALISASKTPEVRAHQSVLMTGNTSRNGCKDSEETKANKSVSRLRYLARLEASGVSFKLSDEHRANVKSACSTPEERARRSESAKAQWARRKATKSW